MSYFDDASLVLIPSGYKDQKIFSVKPLDGSGDLAFSRASSATRVASNGLIEKVRTNLLLQSNSFDTTWVSNGGSGSTVTSGQADPDGGTSAWLFAKLSQTGRREQTITTGASEQTFSIVAKKGTSNFLYVVVFDGTTSHTSYFNLDTGAVGTQSDAVASMVSVGNGWYRCSLTSANVSASGIIQLYISDADGAVSGTTGDIYIYQSQFENGVATDYIATTTAAVSVGPVANVPRLDYLNSSCPRLLLEPQRTNSATYSEQFTNAVWTGSGATVVANQAVSPDGYTNADLLYPATSGNFAGKYQNLAAGTTGVLSCYVKQAGKRFAQLGTDNNATYTCAFDLQLGTVVRTATNYTGTITSVGNGWYRITAAYVSSAGAVYPFIGVSDNAAGAVTVDGTNGLYIWGFQYETSATYATSYIPTLGTSVTRVADFGSNSNTIGTSYSSNDFTYFIEFDLLHDSTDRSPMLFGGGNQALGSSYQGYLRIGLFGNDSIALFGHGDSLMASAISPLTKGTRYKFLVKRSGTSIKFYLNGAQIGSTGTSSLGFTLRSIGWSYAAGSYNTEGNIYQFLAFQTALSDADCIALTA